jgi:hypothetical protein
VEFDLAAATEEVFQSTISSLLAEMAKERAQTLATAAAAEVVRSAAEATVTDFVGPLLRLLFKVSDETSKNTKRLVQAPLLTGLREARDALEYIAKTPEESTIRTERLSKADFELARALSLLSSDAAANRTRTYINLIRGLICIDRGAPELAKRAFRDGLAPLSLTLQEADEFLNRVYDHDEHGRIKVRELGPKPSLIGMLWGPTADARKKDVQPWVRVKNYLPDVQLAFFLRAMINGSLNPIAEARMISIRDGMLAVDLTVMPERFPRRKMDGPGPTITLTRPPNYSKPKSDD